VEVQREEITRLQVLNGCPVLRVAGAALCKNVGRFGCDRND
jgi:hypothetical protein